MELMKIATALLLAVSLHLDAQDAQSLFQLGVTKQNAGDLQGALEAYSGALKAGYPIVPRLQYRIAGVQAKLGDKEKAFAALQAAVDAGFAQVDQLYQNNDFLSIRTDPRFDQLAAAARKNQHPCTASPEFRQFDYWLGEWDVESGGQKIARSSIQLILEDCVVFENYQTIGRLYAGKSFSLWDSAHRRWEQRYVDTTGAFHEWVGGMEGDRMVFNWNYERNGVKTMNRMSYLKEGPDKVRQRIDVSTDDGKTWSVSYDGLYVRRK